MKFKRYSSKFFVFCALLLLAAFARPFSAIPTFAASDVETPPDRSDGGEGRAVSGGSALYAALDGPASSGGITARLALGGSESEVVPGESAELSVLLSGNGGLAAWTFDIAWDESAFSYAPNSAAVGENFKNGTFLTNSKEAGKLAATWYSVRNNSEDGVLFSFKLKAKEGAKAGKYSIALKAEKENTVDDAEREIEIKTEGIELTVSGKESGSSGDGGGSAGRSSGSGSGLSGGSAAATGAETEGSGAEQAAGGAKAGNDKATSFSDVPATHWAYEYIELLAEQGIVSGMGDGSFLPESEVTRAQFVRLLAGLAKESGMGYETKKFSDVGKDDWYMPYIAWAEELGIAKGTSDDMFSPNEPVSREQAATLLYRFSALMGDITAERGGESPAKDEKEASGAAGGADFTDEEKISSWAMEAVQWCAGRGVISGYPDGSFRPQDKTTRAQAAKLIWGCMSA